MALADSIRLAVLLALYTYPDSAIGEEIPESVVKLAEEEGLIGRADGGVYVTDAGRARMTKIMQAIA